MQDTSRSVLGQRLLNQQHVTCRSSGNYNSFSVSSKPHNQCVWNLGGKAMSMDIEVCIVTYGNRETIRHAVESCHLIPGRVGIAIHDNFPSANSVDIARIAAGNLPF